MKFVCFTKNMKSNDAVLWEFAMLFSYESFLQKELKKPMIYEFHGNYIRLIPKKNDILGVGLVFNDSDDNFMYPRFNSEVHNLDS